MSVRSIAAATSTALSSSSYVGPAAAPEGPVGTMRVPVGPVDVPVGLEGSPVVPVYCRVDRVGP